MIQEAQLHVEYFAVNPKKPASIGVFVDGKIVAVVALEEFERVIKVYQEMKAERESSPSDNHGLPVQ